MTISGQHGNRYFCFHAVLILMLFFSTVLAAAGLSGNQPGMVRFELRLASMEKVEGWESIPGPESWKTPVWISPEATLTNIDVAQAWPDLMDDKFCVGLLLTEEGALKLARLTKAHIGESVAVMTDGRVISMPRINAEIVDGRVRIEGNFTEEEARSIAEGITGQ